MPVNNDLVCVAAKILDDLYEENRILRDKVRRLETSNDIIAAARDKAYAENRELKEENEKLKKRLNTAFGEAVKGGKENEIQSNES